MPRPKKLTDCVRREIYIPVELSVIVETLHFDPMKQRAKYGAVSDYVISLIRKDLRERGLIPG